MFTSPYMAASNGVSITCADELKNIHSGFWPQQSNAHAFPTEATLG